MSKYRAALIQGAWFVTILSTFLVCLSLSWLTLAKLQYLYPAWYSLLDIEKHITTYAPQNNIKQGYELVGTAERKEHFAQIAQAVHNQGHGLEDISYLYRGQSRPLLTQAERIHLQDVANLIAVVKKLTLALVVLSSVLLTWLWLCSARPNTRAQVAWLFGLTVMATLSLLLFGATKIFYQLHEWIFPKHHQWFFYYQESLMSTLMKAPDLFGAIGGAILLGGLFLFAGFAWLLSRMFKQ